MADRCEAGDLERTGPYATVEQIGRWTYHVSVHHDLVVLTPGHFVLGHNRARRKAERELLRYVESQRRSTAVERVRLADG